VRVLCIDDEPLILKVVVRMMPMHVVTCFVDSCAAIVHLLGKDAPVYDAILCDLLMPNCSGVDVHRALVLGRPDLASRIIFFTGMGAMPGDDVFLDSVPNPRLGKPFLREELLDAIALVSSLTSLQLVSR
jgi:CheY-like chemotaxis protein